MGIISQIFALAATVAVAWATQGASLWVQGAAIFATSMVVSRIFGQKPPKPQDNGVRQQVPPATVNSLPIVYGEAYLGGTFVDACLTEDQKQMYYVLAISSISPNGQFTYDMTKMYYGDRLITFAGDDQTRVQSLTDGAGNVDTKINTNLNISLYTSDASGNITNINGQYPWSSSTDSMGSGSGLPSNLQWPSTGRKMYGTAFAIVRLNYNADAGTTQLQPITFKVKQALNGTGVAKPGDVWADYLGNTIYGGAVDSSLIDTATATALNNYSDELITFTNNEGNPSTQPRYRINGVLDTGTNVLENVDKLLECCDSWMTYNSASGQWSIVVNKAQDATMAFNDDNIIGDIKTSTLDINQSVNQIEAKFPNKLNKDVPGYVYLTTPSGLLYPNEPVNKYTTEYALVNDSVQAQYLANRVLEQAREDLIITITTTYYGIQANAGDVVSLTNATYGWSAKLFRVLKVQEAALPDGTLGATLDLSEYNAQVYDDKDITQYQPAPNSDLASSDYFSSLSAPTISDQQQNAAVPSFSVNCLMPATGRVTNIYLYYTTTSTPSTTDWTLLGTQSASNSQPFTNSTYVKFTHISLPTNTYYFAFKVSNETSQSNLSSVSTGFNWLPNPTTSAVAGTFVATWSPATIQVPYNGTTATFTGIAPQLYGTTSGGSVDFVLASTDADALFVNNSWRIGATSTTGLADIVKNNITIGNPTDGGNYALFPTPTAMAANNATLSVPVRYKDDLGNVVQGATAILQFTYSVQGSTGDSGTQHGTAFLYQWSTSTPSNPNGSSTYTWATSSNGSYTGSNGWTTTVPSNPGTPLIKLYTATKGISAPGTDVTTAVSWASGFSVQEISQNGANGANGIQSANPTVYQWAVTIPSAPTGTSTYTWSSNTFTPTPSGWSLTGGTSPSEGYTLWAAKVNIVDSATATTSIINWTLSSISAVGYSGTTGTTGASARICYTKTTLSSLASSPSTITTSGSSSYPPNDSWGTGTVWQATPPSIVAGESVYQSDGIYSPTTGNTVWNVPYLSALKVGSLSAITTNTGNLTVSGTIQSNTAAISGTTMTGSGMVAYSSGNFAIGNSTNNITYNGSAINLNGTFVSPTTFTPGNMTTGTAASAWLQFGQNGVVISTNLKSAFNVRKVVSDTTLVNMAAQNNVDGNVTIWGHSAAQALGNGNAVAGSYTSVNTFSNWQLIGVLGSGLRSCAVWGSADNTSTATMGGYFEKATNISTTNIISLATNSYCAYSASGQGKIYIVDGNGPFTGFHEGMFPLNQNVELGDIVVDGDVFYKNGISSVLMTSEISNTANEIAIGVVSQILNVEKNVPGVLWETIQIPNPDPEALAPLNETVLKPPYNLEELQSTYKVVHINSVGEGQINVCGQNGNINKGDLIVVSDLAGKGMKQSDDIIRTSTVAKARESVTFSSSNEVKLIACIYLCG